MSREHPVYLYIYTYVRVSYIYELNILKILKYKCGRVLCRLAVYKLCTASRAQVGIRHIVQTVIIIYRASLSGTGKEKVTGSFT